MAFFSIWMLIDAIRRKEFLWVFLILAGLGSLVAIFTFIATRPPPCANFERLPGAQSRARIKELQAQIHHLDKAHHYFQLGDV